LTRAHIARETDDNKTALKLYNRIIEEQTYLIAEALPEIITIYEREDRMADLDKRLRAMLDKNPEMSSLIAYTAIVNDLGGVPVIDECVDRYMLDEPTLSEFVDLEQLAGGREEGLERVRRALANIAARSPRYQCQECGFSSQRLLWQCPSCRSWETQRPAQRVQFDTLLQRSITA
jgi:lipopolysaccharide biosynthesis regulator YciM